MKKVFLLLSVLVGILVVSSCAQTQPEETTLPPEPEETTLPPEPEETTLPPEPEGGIFRVEVSRNGFDNTPGEFRLEVEAGQEVEITFVYGDGDFPLNNPHLISIPDYGLITGFIDRDNLEVTLRFTAGEAGEVTFVCIVEDCVGHTNLQGGIIEIH